jgi:hypothetical protein
VRIVLSLLAVASIITLNAQANPAHMHVGHVADSFKDTPKQQGLLPTAAGEARIAAQHAALAVKSPDNLDALKLHAGHVLHALDPTLVEKGPGLGYGLKKAATAAATHIELAAKAEGASANVKTHAGHVSASLGNVSKRSDEMIQIAQKMRTSSSAKEAGDLATQLSALAQQVTAGIDANKDGRISWEAGEGGLQQAEQHLALLKKGESLP